MTMNSRSATARFMIRMLVVLRIRRFDITTMMTSRLPKKPSTAIRPNVTGTTMLTTASKYRTRVMNSTSSAELQLVSLQVSSQARLSFVAIELKFIVAICNNFSEINSANVLPYTPDKGAFMIAKHTAPSRL